MKTTKLWIKSTSTTELASGWCLLCPPVSAVVVAVTDVQLAVRAQDAQRALLITSTASIDTAVAAHHRQTVRVLLIGRQVKKQANPIAAAGSHLPSQRKRR